MVLVCIAALCKLAAAAEKLPKELEVISTCSAP